jgi:hypothetical protein
MAFGSVAPLQGDVESLKVHLGCTKEVSSFEVDLKNWDSKYSTSPNAIALAQDGHVDVGRGANVPQLITCRVEDLEYESSALEHYLKVKGRCWGEKLFRKCVTKTYENQKGEAIVKDLIDYYVGLSHVRNLVELIEDTDTTYTKLEYKDTPVFDIISFIAETADKNGVIGYDFRVAPDGKFEFFPRLSKASSVSLSEKIETAAYRKDISRVRNKITIYGAAEKSWPTDKDRITEVLAVGSDQLIYYEDSVLIGWWEQVGLCVVSLDGTIRIKGSYSVKLNAPTGVASSVVDWYFATEHYFNMNDYPSLNLQLRRETEPGKVGFKIELYDVNDQKLRKMLEKFDSDKWKLFKLNVGEKNADEWTIDEFNTQAFDWTQIRRIRFEAYMDGNQTGAFWVDNMFFNHRRWESTKEDATSQSLYGVREYVEVDDELHSDEECRLRADALLAWKKDYAEYITVITTVLDYGTTPILAGDKIYADLPNELIGAYFRVISAEYAVNVKAQSLTVTLELGKEPPLFADYIFALRKNERKHARYKIARI